MKKFAVLLALGMMLALAGCVQHSADGSSSNSSSSNSGTVNSGQTSGTAKQSSAGSKTTSQSNTSSSDKIVSQLTELEGVLNNLDDVPSGGMDIPVS